MSRKANLIIPILVILLSCSTMTWAQDFPSRPDRVDTDRQGNLEFQLQLRRGLTSQHTLRIAQTVETLGSMSPAAPALTIQVPVRLQVQAVEEGDTSLVRTLGTPTVRNPGTTIRPDDLRSFISSLDGARIVETLDRSGARLEHEAAIDSGAGPFSVRELVSDVLAFQLPELPSEPLQIGDSWNVSRSMSFVQGDPSAQGRMTALLTVAGFAMLEGREHVLVDVEWTLELEADLTLLDSQRTRQSALGHGRGEGFMLIDPATGLVSQQAGRIGTVVMLGSREADRRRQFVEMRYSISR
ncbi:MAG: hypothetical protein EA398_06125 [Deltaproteobacteria bacterium]|nr:MAG: hypothetical protein EA398_06125 [Deltaproteobacteria bacterium]